MASENDRIPPREAIAYAAELIERARALVITAGAGIGVDSGLPDFRGNNEFWQAYPALHRAGLSFKDVATATCFDSDPYRAWGFYGHRLALYRKTSPHLGFTLIKNWTTQLGHQYAVFTSNVDGQFQRAGFSPDRLHECHGSIHYLQCTVPCTQEIWSAEGLAVHIDESNCRWLGKLPACPHCGAPARPNIQMFHDSRCLETRIKEQERQQEAWLIGVQAPVVVEIGAGTAQPAVRNFSQRMMKERKARLVRINPASSQDEDGDVIIAMPALSALRAIDKLLQERSADDPIFTMRTHAQSLNKQPSFAWTEPTGGGVPWTQQSTTSVTTSKTRVGKKHAEQTLQRRLTLLSFLPAIGHGGISVQALTRKLNDAGYSCSTRTVERDLVEMADPSRVWHAAGVEIEMHRDPANAQVPLWAYKTPAKPLMLRLPPCEDALLIGLLAKELQAFVPDYALNALTAYGESSARGWNRSGNGDSACYQQKICILPDGPMMLPPPLNLLHLREVNQALLRNEQINLRYLAARREGEGSYRLHPLGIVKKGNFFWLIAAEEEMGKVLPDVCTFRMDRIRWIQRRVNEPVMRGLPLLQEVIDSGVLEFFPARNVELVLHSTPGCAGDQLMDDYAESPLSTDQRIVSLPDGRQELTATVKHTRELEWMLQSQAHRCEVLAPTSLRQKLQRFATEVAQQYGASITVVPETKDNANPAA